MSRRRGGAGLVALLLLLVVAPAADATPSVDPVSVLLVGDSLMAEAGPHAVSRLRAAGYDARVEAVPGSGMIASYQPDDWVMRAAVLVERHDPDVVVVQFCCNHWPAHQPDWWPWRDIIGDTPVFYELWESRLREVAAQLTKHGATSLWVLSPPSGRSGVIEGLNDVMTRVAVDHGAPLVDWAGTFAPGGTPRSHIPGHGQVRHDDGLHFTPAGAAIAGRMVADSVVAAVAPDPVVGVANASTGYWTVSAGGTVTAHDGAPHHGDMSSRRLNQPVITMAATASGNGYWLVAADGGIFTFGDAHFHGSTGHLTLNQPVVGMAATPTGRGYWMVARDGGIFSFGDAGFRGSAAAAGPRSVQGIVPRPSGGYTVVDRLGATHHLG